MRHTRITCDLCGESARYTLELKRGDGVYNIYDGGYSIERDLCHEHADIVMEALGLPFDIKRDRPRVWNAERSSDETPEQTPDEEPIGLQDQPPQRDEERDVRTSQDQDEGVAGWLRRWHARRRRP